MFVPTHLRAAQTRNILMTSALALIVRHTIHASRGRA